MLVLVGFFCELRRSMWVWEDEGASSRWPHLLPLTGDPGQDWALFRLLLTPWHLGTEPVLRGISGLSVPGRFPSPGV